MYATPENSNTKMQEPAINEYIIVVNLTIADCFMVMGSQFMKKKI